MKSKIGAKFRRLFVFLYWILTGLGLFLVISGMLINTTAIANNNKQAQPGNPVPTITWQNTQLPDWGRITFKSLPPLAEAGGFAATPEMIEKLGYVPSRSWPAGTSADQILTLGDVKELGVQKLNMQTIAQQSGRSLGNTKLSEFGPLQFQTLSSLVEAVPKLAEFPIDQVKPVEGILQQQLTTQFDTSQPIGKFLSSAPHLKDLSVSGVGDYTLADIPNLESAPLDSFKNWEAATIAGVPGLSEVPFTQFPNPLNPVGAEVGTVDLILGAKEQNRTRTISGSDVEGFSVPCEKECAHVELGGAAAHIKGKQWVSGKYQEVKGGHGALAVVNGGMEPTGRHPFGPAFKVVIWDVSESPAQISQALFFRVCSGALGCTPYFLGPVPWMVFAEKSPIFLGALSSEISGTVRPISTGINANAIAALPLAPPPQKTCDSYEGVVVDALKGTLSEQVPNYTKLGASFCPSPGSPGNCERKIGAYQLNSKRTDVRSLIQAKTGGEEFLKRLDTGELVAGTETAHYLSPIEQESLFGEDIQQLISTALRQIDYEGQVFQGDRLLERVGQMHFAGPAIPIDSVAKDLKNSQTVREYGQKIADNYFQEVKRIGC